MTQFVYPTPATIEQIAQDKIARLAQDRPVFKIFPIANADATTVMWDQLDNFKGLQQFRGVNGQPPTISKIGAKRYRLEPGIYGEVDVINEQDLMERAKLGTFGQPVEISDLIMQSQDQLLARRLDRIELIIFTLLTTGTFAVTNAAGQVVHTDTFPIQTFSSVVGWSTPGTSTPLADTRQLQLDAQGHSVSFGSDSELWINLVQKNRLLSNTNPADLYGRRQAGLGLINNLDDVNKLLAGDGLPTIRVYNEGYYDETGTYQKFIPDGMGVLVGKRPAGQVVGQYKMVRNVNNPNMAAGPYMRVIDKGENYVPRTIEVHDGHNGGPAIFFPSAIVACNFG